MEMEKKNIKGPDDTRKVFEAYLFAFTFILGLKYPYEGLISP